jgi:hypothetical protein
VECCGRTCRVRGRIRYHYRWPCRAEGGKRSVPTEGGPVAIGRYDAKMIRGACTQAGDVRTDILRRVPSLGLTRGGVPIAGRRSILKMHCRSQSMRINHAIEPG